jgi:hypothetical protein
VIYAFLPYENRLDRLTNVPVLFFVGKACQSVKCFFFSIIEELINLITSVNAYIFLDLCWLFLAISHANLLSHSSSPDSNAQLNWQDVFSLDAP